MPIFSHKCECQETVVDDLYKSADDCPKTFVADCKTCGKKQVVFTKVISGTGGFRLKGPGVYKPTSSFD